MSILNFAARFGQTRPHSINKEILDTSAYMDKGKTTRMKDILKLHFDKLIDSLPTQKNFWISDWGVVTGYFGNRKVSELKN